MEFDLEPLQSAKLREQQQINEEDVQCPKQY